MVLRAEKEGGSGESEISPFGLQHELIHAGGWTLHLCIWPGEGGGGDTLEESRRTDSWE